MANPDVRTCIHLLFLFHSVHEGGGRQLPRPAPPPSSLLSDHHPAPQVAHAHRHYGALKMNVNDDGVFPQPSAAEALCSSGVMCWSHEEVCVGTEGFSHSLQVGEGGFGVVYKATLKKTVYAVKRLKQVSQSQHSSDMTQGGALKVKRVGERPSVVLGSVRGWDV